MGGRLYEKLSGAAARTGKLTIKKGKGIYKI